MKFIKKEKGITLIALIITIIVLLILAGVTISMVVGDNGVLTQAGDAKLKTKIAEEKEIVDLAASGARLKNEDINSNILKSDLIQELDSLIGVGKYTLEGEGPYTVTYNDSGRSYEVNSSPTEGPENPGYDIFTEKKTVNGEEPSSENPMIPVGFRPVDTDTSKWDDPEGNVDKGLVIEDKDHNQFVWVPVPDPNKMFDTVDGRNVGKLYDYDVYTKEASEKEYESNEKREPAVLETENMENIKEITGITDDDVSALEQWKNQLQSEFDLMKKSVSKYGGFWIGRYETGNLDMYEVSMPVVQCMNTNIQSGHFYNNYITCKKFSEGKEGIISTMCWGSQWDATLNWFIRCGGTTAQYPFGGHGNYSMLRFPYKTPSGEEATKTYSGLIPTGSAEYTKMNNIYDLAGNVEEYTLEPEGSSTRVLRGSRSGVSNSSASNREITRSIGGKGDISPLEAGTRMTIFIND